MCVRVCVHTQSSLCGCVDGSWEADTVQENRPLATDLFGRWQFQSNSHPASQWPWPPNISITSSSTGLPQPVTHRREGRRLHSSQRADTCTQVSSLFFNPLVSIPKHSTHISLGLPSTVPMFPGYAAGQSKGMRGG